MQEANTDVGALSAGALAAALAVLIGAGGYTLVSCVVSVTLLLVLFGYAYGRRVPRRRMIAIAGVTGLSSLPIVGFFAQLFSLTSQYEGVLYLIAWAFIALISYLCQDKILKDFDLRTEIELQALPTSNDQSPVLARKRIRSLFDKKDERAFEQSVYGLARPYAFLVRTILQWVIGALIVIVLCAKAVGSVQYGASLGSNELVAMRTLTFVGHALAYAAGIELAYMLFTPGPDEAVQPVILGLAAATLIIISKPDGDWKELIFAPLFCASIGVLLYVNRKFIEEPRGGGRT